MLGAACDDAMTPLSPEWGRVVCSFLRANSFRPPQLHCRACMQQHTLQFGALEGGRDAGSWPLRLSLTPPLRRAPRPC